MKMSPAGRALLEDREGRHNNAYRDSEGIWTIGVGHTGPEVHDGLHWTNAQIDEAFEKDLGWVEAALAESVLVPILQNQWDGLGSFTFNVGADGEEHSTLVKEINAGRPLEEIAAQFDRWHIPAEITTRRNGEKFQFLGKAFLARCDANGNPIP